MTTAPLIIIPARGGSKGVPGKNLRTVGGISLIGRAVRTARAACHALGGGRVVVDSDNAGILAEGRIWGAETPYVRPAELATDGASSLAVIIHALQRLGIASDDPRPIVLMQATSPFTSTAHLVACIRESLAHHGMPVVGVTPADHPPAWHFARDAGGGLLPIYAGWDAVRRQDLPVCWRQTGAVNIANAADILQGRDFVQPGRTRLVEAPAAEALDIDTEADLALAEAGLAARPVTPFTITDPVLGRRTMGPGHPCFIIAEAGVNHDGDPREAHRLVDAAADAGADAVKFQTWRTELVCRPGAAKAGYQIETTGAGDDQFTMLKRLELPYAIHHELKAHAETRGILFLSTPDEEASCRFLARDLGLPALKIGSAEVDNLPYLTHVAGYGLPVMLSTGMADLAEIARAVDTLRAAGDAPLALFHCVTSYPAPIDAMNVRALATLRAAFGVPVGLSDHCPSVEPVLAAIGVGCDLWEKHLTTDRSRSGPDHRASLDPAEFKRQVAAVRAAEQALGDGRKTPHAIELVNRTAVRRRLHAQCDLPAGHHLTAADLLGLRSGDGLPMSAWEGVLGRALRRPVTAGSPISRECLDD